MHMKKIDSLTSLRFFAAACIVLGHGASRFHYSFSLFDLRHGVTFFFVLSGFILCYTYANVDWKQNYRDFFAARIARLYPASLVTSVAAVLVLAPIANAEDVVRLLVNSLLLQAWIPVGSWHYAFNAVTWSISTEMFFYVVFPLALAFLRRTQVFLVCLLIPAATMILLASALDLSSTEGGPKATAWGLIYVNPVSRVTEFLSGMLAYKFSRRVLNSSGKWSTAKGTLIELGAVALLLSCMVLATYAGGHLLKELAPRFGIYVQVISPFPFMALFILVMSQEKGLLSKWLSCRFLVYLGEVSFSLYLVHQLVVRWMFAKYQVLVSANLVPAYFFYWGFSLILAMMLFHLVEKPLRQPLRKLLRGDSAVARPIVYP